VAQESILAFTCCESIVSILPFEDEVSRRLPCFLKKDRIFIKRMLAQVIVKYPECAEIEAY